MKQCSKCQKTKDFSDFHKRSASNDGYAPYCKLCMSDYARSRRTYKLEKMFKSDTHKECRDCRKILEISNFPKSRNGTAPYCRPCKTIRSGPPRKTKKLLVTPTHKECRMCSQMVLHDLFEKRSDGKLSTYCLSCRQAYNRKRVIERHGLTVEIYLKTLEDQGGACYGCQRVTDESLCIDHDHSCCPGLYGCRKCFRGLLCSGCNRVLGLVADNAETLTRLSEHLSRRP